MSKKICLLLITTAFYTSLMINYPSDFIKSLGYNQALDFYARKVSSLAVCKVLYNPGIRPLNRSANPKIGALLPSKGGSYAARLDRLIAGHCEVIVECSAADTWHTGLEGQDYLIKLRNQAYRVVIFDGGHHLPTLGMQPDIIIVPELAGYAVHSYMVDGMKLVKLKQLLAAAGSPTMLVSVPRWALVKNEQSLRIIVSKALDKAKYQSKQSSFQPVVRERMSKTRGMVFAWINDNSLANRGRLIDNLESMGTHDLKHIYLAFDYSRLGYEEAANFASMIRQEFGVPVEIVNQAVKTANVYWGGYNVLP